MRTLRRGNTRSGRLSCDSPVEPNKERARFGNSVSGEVMAAVRFLWLGEAEWRDGHETVSRYT